MYEPIVSEALYDQVQFVLTGSRRKHSYKVCAKQKLPLRGFLNCPRCGNKLTGSASTGGTSIKHFYYHCTKGSKERVKADIINNAFSDFIAGFKFKASVKELYDYILKGSI